MSIHIKNLWSETEIEFLKNNYFDKGGIYCSHELNRSAIQVRQKANALGLKVDPILITERNQALGKAKCGVDCDYFIRPTEPEAAYILGFLWADGYLLNKGCNPYRIALEIIESDMLDIENMFLKSGKWCSSIRLRENRQPQKTLVISNRDLYNFLCEHNYDKKSYFSACSILNYLPEHLRSAWFQGYFDGDGCYYVKCGDCIISQCSISSDYNQDFTFIENQLKLLDIRYTIRRIGDKKNGNNPKSKFSDIRFCKRTDVIKWENYITSCGLVGLSRKRDKIKQLIDTLNINVDKV